MLCQEESSFRKFSNNMNRMLLRAARLLISHKNGSCKGTGRDPSRYEILLIQQKATRVTPTKCSRQIRTPIHWHVAWLLQMINLFVQGGSLSFLKRARVIDVFRLVLFTAHVR